MEHTTYSHVRPAQKQIFHPMIFIGFEVTWSAGGSIPYMFKTWKFLVTNITQR